MNQHVNKRILFFIETGGPGGAEQVVYQLAKAWRERGCEVAVATVRTGWLTERLNADGITHVHLPSEKALDLSLPWRLAKLARNYDVLHAHLFDSNVYGLIAARLAGIAFLGTEHGDIHHIDQRKLSGIKFLLLRLLRGKITAVSEFTRQALLSKGLSESAVSVVGNPVRDEQFKIPRRAVSTLGLPTIPEGAYIWVHVANHRPVKDQPTLLRGFAKASRRCSRPQVLLLVGDGPEREMLQAITRAEAIADTVFFLGFRQDVPDILSAAHGCILTSHSEALPMSLLEAGAQGLCLVSSDVGGVRDIIEPERSGYIFPKSDYDALAAVLQRAVEDPNSSAALGRAAQQHIKQHYSLEVVLAAFDRLYSKH